MTLANTPSFGMMHSPHALVDSAVAVAFLSYLGHLQLHIPRVQSGTHGKASEINALHHQVLAKGPVYDIGSAAR